MGVEVEALAGVLGELLGQCEPSSVQNDIHAEGGGTPRGPLCQAFWCASFLTQVPVTIEGS